MPRRALALLCVACLLLGTAPACSRIRHHFGGGGGGAPKIRNGTLGVVPAAGKVGTLFTFTAGGFRPGEALTFEVDIPGLTPFIGPSHTADPGGTVSASYTPLASDPVGTYAVKAVGNEGTRAQATLSVTH